MYNRYIPTAASYLPLEPPPSSAPSAAENRPTSPPPPSQNSPSPPPSSPQSAVKSSKDPSKSGFSLRSLLSTAGLSADGASALSDLLRRFHLDELDLGDVLLAAVLLLLILEEGDNLDVLITLGVMLLVSLSEP